MATTQPSISAPVGRWEDPVVKKKSGNHTNDTKTVQKLLINASKALKDAKYNPGSPDGKIAKAPRNSNTLNAIYAFQTRFMKEPDRRVDVGGNTWTQLLKYSEEDRENTVTINPKSLVAFCQAMMDGHCKYGFGSKASPLSTEPKDVKKIDCSGFVRYLLYQVTDGKITIPDGSWKQDEWFRSNRFVQVDYEETKKRDGVLRLGYFSGSPGHIWFVRNGKTIESHGSKGPNRRDWNNSTLKRRVMRCYVISKLPATLDQSGGVLA